MYESQKYFEGGKINYHSSKRNKNK
jgi:hypothetical protein